MRRYPVAIMRWFRDGNAWSYDASVSGETMTQVLDRVSPLVVDPGRYAYAVELPDGRWIVGTREPDEQCLDARARDRKPFVVKVAIVSERPGEAVACEIARRLELLDAPVEPGPRGLEVVVALRSLERPKTRRPVHAFSTLSQPLGRLLGAFAALTLTGVAMLVPHLRPVPSFWTIGIHASAFVIGAAILWFTRVAGFTFSTIERCEQTWDDSLISAARERAVGPPVAEGVLSETTPRAAPTTGALSDPAGAVSFRKTTIVTRAGRVREFQSATEIAAEAYAMELPVVVRRDYDDCVVTPDAAVVRGTESVEDVEGKSRTFHFVRQYGRDGRAFALVFAQWTACGE